MKSHFCVTTLFALAAAQKVTVPADLAQSFSSSGTEGLQVSFGSDASEGITDGQTISLNDAQSPPTFALGDSSGVNRAISYTIIMLDTTDRNARKVQFLQKAFKATGDKTKLAAEGEPFIPYKPPSFGQGPRQFSFLLYQQRGQDLAQLSGVPSSGTGPFDLKKFETANNLQPPQVGMAITMLDDGNADEPRKDHPLSTSALPFEPFSPQDISSSPFVSALIPVLPTASSLNTKTAGDTVEVSFPAFAFTSGSPTTISTPLLSLATSDSQLLSEQSTITPASTVSSSFQSASPSVSPSVSPSASPSVSAPTSPAARQTRTSIVVVTASPTSTATSSSGELVGAAREADNDRSAGASLYGSAYGAMFLEITLLVTQAGLYMLVL
ncbi:conserved hypothetical protein [Histoplasma capsulatum H143]|uniref:Uncharacterized protein n=1 Tax=Ajellomyces capsulatus (strain H143) TaxID=544712 RepID=C6H680_AJECH|nr:conserved hypothetical protein [Histoplasma capsulatum H143]